MVLIGIDPPKGLAVSVDGRLTTVITTSFWDIINELDQHRKSGNAMLVYIENTNANKSLYAKHNGKGHNIRTRIAQNVGSNKRDASLLMEWMDRNKIEYIAVPPRKDNQTKNNSTIFKKITGWDAATSEHGRDAAMLFWGRSWQYDIAVKRGS